MAASLLNSPLADVARLPLRPSSTVLEFGRTLVVAPHPDDESLGCGGTIALLRDHDMPVHVLFVSDGAGSHPNSRQYPAARLTALRECEALDALAILGVGADAATFLRLPDRFVPRADSAGFADAARHFRVWIHRLKPATILLPWRRDPHCDHRATWDLVTHAAPATTRLIEYPVWVWELGEHGDAPQAGEMHGWRLDIEAVLTRKLAAIAAHVSQTTGLIDDDPEGFQLSDADLRHFNHSWEVYLEPETCR